MTAYPGYNAPFPPVCGPACDILSISYPRTTAPKKGLQYSLETRKPTNHPEHALSLDNASVRIPRNVRIAFAFLGLPHKPVQVLSQSDYHSLHMIQISRPFCMPCILDVYSTATDHPSSSGASSPDANYNFCLLSEAGNGTTA